MQTEEADFYRTQIQAYNNAYKNFSELQGVLQQQFAPILARGPGQFGYTPQEATALRTQAGEGTAQNYAQAARAMEEGIASRGGGVDTSNITSGGANQLREQLAAASAGEESREQLGITTSGYDLGRQMWGQAVSGTEALASGWNPNSFSQSTVNAGNAAASEANTIAQQQNAMWGSVLGALGGVAGAAAGNLNVGPFKSG